MDIKDFKDGDRIEKIFLVANATKGVTATGAMYLNVLLQDKTGVIESRKWDAGEESMNAFKPENFVFVHGEIIKYRNAIQMKINEFRLINPIEESIDYSDFLISAPVSKSELEESLNYFIQQITDAEINLLVNHLVKKYYNQLLTYPAGMKVHHAYVGGLLHHVITMLKVAEPLTSLYHSLDKNYLYAGIILHDLGKLTELTGEISTKYTTEGRLLGHISIFSAELFRIGVELNINKDKLMLLQHMILAHHGKLEHGSPVQPATMEANMLSLIDRLDSESNAIEKALEGIEEGEFTSRIYALDERSFFKVPKKD